MGSVPLHPAIVHLPLALALLIPFFAVGAAIAIHRGKLPRWVWAVVLGLQVVMAATGFVAMQSGEQDEERVESVVPESAIEAHEEAAEVFVWTGVGLAVVFAFGLALPRPGWRSAAMAVAVLGSVAVAALALSAGHAGGELVYRHGAASAHVRSSSPRGAALPGTHLDDDDDD